MIMLTSLAALALSVVPAPTQSPVQTPTVTDQTKVEVATVPALVAPSDVVAKTKPWLAPDVAKPKAELAAPKL